MHEGRVLAGKYRLLNKLTAGGMGSVWRAEHVELGSPAAVKVLEATIADSTEALARFRREAQSAASLRSTNIVQVFDFGVDGHTPYIAMELLRGKSLADRLRENRTLPPQETAAILAQVARAAAWAHSRGIAHRDLKPGNVFLSEDANDIVVKLLDFGIAKPLRLDLSATPVTLDGAIMGTPQYMSPEQAAGKRNVDHRTDIWSFAVIAFECLTGRHAFEADTLGGLVLAICTEPLPVPSRHGPVPEGFDEWFARAANRDPALRFDDIAEAGEALLALCGVDSAVSSRSLRFFSAERMQAPAPVRASGGQRPLEPGPGDDATTEKALTVPALGSRARKLMIFLGLFGTGAAAAAMLHSQQLAGQRSQAAPEQPVASEASRRLVAPAAGGLVSDAGPPPATDAPALPSARRESENPAAARARKAFPSPIRASMVPASSARSRPPPDKGSPPVASSTPQPPVKESPAETAGCDPKVKNQLGFCPRPGK